MKILTTSILILLNCCLALANQEILYKIVDEQGDKPLANHSLHIYYFVYDVHFDNPNANYFLDSVKTDSLGFFSLDMSKWDYFDIIVQPGKPYLYTGFWRSEDLSRKFSRNHIRIFHTKVGQTKGLGNYIYDLGNKTVEYIPIKGKATTQDFNFVLLRTKIIP